MRIAFIGHSYHRTTRSTAFFLELLKRCGEVEFFYDDSWLNGVPADWAASVQADDFDCIVVFQTPEPMAQLDLRHPNFIFVPMLDGHFSNGQFWWRERFSEAKVVCFSATLNREIAPITPVRFFAHYFPPVDGLPALENPDRLSAFFWYRRPPIDPVFLRKVTGRTVFDRLTLQRALDPGVSLVPTPGGVPLARELEEAPSWRPERESYLERLAEHTVYFAPRLFEGIGMGFLEAMALGLCVVAPDTPTHNEYISHGTTGLLYDPTRPAPLDFGDFRQLGLRAKASVEHQRFLWESAEADLVDFICTPKLKLDRQRTLVDFWRRAPVPKSVDAPALVASLPAVTLVIVRDDREGHLEATLSSVTEQDYPSLKHVVARGILGDGVDGSNPDDQNLIEHRRAMEDSAHYIAMIGSLDRVKSEYVIFMHAGDSFVSSSSVRQLLRDAPNGADVIFGHYIHSDSNGFDELRLVADFEQSCARLDATRYDPHWMQRLPVLPATAIRTTRLRQFGFDPQLRFAADYDFYRRLARSGAVFFGCDRVIAHCRPEGTGSHVLPTYVEEWLRIAIRHGGSSAARRILAGMGVDPVESWEATLRGWVDRARRRNRSRFAWVPPSRRDEGRDSGSPLAKVLQWGVSAAARLLAAVERRSLAGRSSRAAETPEAGVEHDETYLSEFRKGIDFRRHGRPSYVAKLKGISWREEWGRWTDGPRVEIQFRHSLPRRARIVLETFAFAGISPCKVDIALGAASARVAIAGEPFQVYSVDLETPNNETVISFSIPLPSPAAAQSIAGQAERRRLGLALRKLTVLEY